MEGRVENMLGALAVGLGDLLRAETEAPAGLGNVDPAALVTVLQWPGETIDALSKTVGLSHSATVRLVDRLAARGLVGRTPGPGRSVNVHVTPRGEQLARSVLAARRRALGAVLTGLDPADREALASVLEKVLPPLVIDPVRADLICRLCDFDACSLDRCPVHERQRELLRPGHVEPTHRRRRAAGA